MRTKRKGLNMKNIIILLFLGLLFGQSDLGREAGQIKMQNEVIDNLIIDDGYSYSIQETFTLGTANDTSLIVFHNDSAGTAKYLKWDIGGLVATTIVIIEGAVFARSPDALTVVNLDRNSSNTTGMDSIYAVYEDSTLTTSYTDTLFNLSIGALQSAQGKMILADDSLTVFKIVSDASSNKVYCKFDWKE